MTNPALNQTDEPEAPQAESLKDVTKVNRVVYLTVIIILGVVLLAAVIGWLVLASQDRRMPEGLSVIVGAIAGGLVGLLSGKDR